ncbi:hypothetical protein JTE90_020831 [Oedothorax gibbosus]|uniref:MD-2-related lipid-recognition domain-containing protein n=1 Tax=Oedothorax gibbosus TaxID=931172 RepID=A0AAV6U303_9ARAC|nr:hypothetical protein JTE90_020831 [Oedothorax gibbosus]
MIPTTSFLFLVVAAFSLAEAKKIEVLPCINNGGDVISVHVEPCDKEPCEIPKGTSAVISVKCISNVDAQKLRLSVWADLAGVELPYPGMKRDACKGKNITCPITKGQEINYVQNFEVRKFFPNVETKARFNLKTNDNQDKVVCCFRAPVKVVSAPDVKK